MPNTRKIYLLNPKILSPETIAVAFAKTSRSPKSFQEIADELSDESSAEFHEKWVLGYGHASVAEHAVLHIAIENISRLAIEVLEGNRLASYTEKSTRYQKWGLDHFYIPEELENHQLRGIYESTCRLLFETYQQSIPLVRQEIHRLSPPNPGESDTTWDKRIRSEYVDVCRYLLPASSLANVGVTINARALEYAINKFLSHPLDEVKRLGQEVKLIAKQEVPTLVKYADSVAYLEDTQTNFQEISKSLLLNSQSPNDRCRQDWCHLISYDSQAENRILAAVIYRFGKQSFANSLQSIQNIPPEERQRYLTRMLEKLKPHDIPIRELEHAYYTFDVLLDQGAYFELKRHRMMTQTAQSLNTYQDFVIPRKIVTAGFKDQYVHAMSLADKTFRMLEDYNPHLASYVVPNGFRRRVLLTLNLRSAFHLIDLRAAPNAHFSIRRIALRIAEQITQVTPTLAAFLNLPPNVTWQQIETEHFDLV